MPSKGLARHSKIHTYSFSEEKVGGKGERSRKELDIIAQTTITSFSSLSLSLTIGSNVVQRVCSTELLHPFYKEN